jgi:catechol 2,3-dioxygenase-like lactoylglutathione lyase family enzyme
MNERTSVIRVSPMLAVADMDESVDFFKSVLGFTPIKRSTEYSVLERDGQSIHLMAAASEEVLDCVRGHTEIYIEVKGIRSLWERVSGLKGRYRIRDLFDRDYGMTEFHIDMPQGECLIFVGEPTARTS